MKHALAFLLVFPLTGCIVQTDHVQGEPGVTGEQGPPGSPGASPFSLSGDDAYYIQGSVGIGTDLPMATLDVLGDAPVAATGVISGNDTNIIGSGTAFLSEVAPGDEILVDDQGVIVRSVETDSALTLVTPFLSPANASAFSIRHPVLVLSTAERRILTATSHGEVGIGTSTPAATLDIVGSLRVGSTGSTLFLSRLNGDYQNEIVFTNGGGYNGRIVQPPGKNDLAIESVGLNVKVLEGPVTMNVGGGVAAGVGYGAAGLTGGNETNVLVYGRSSAIGTASAVQFGDNDAFSSRQFAVVNGHDGLNQKPGRLFFLTTNQVNVDPISTAGLAVLTLSAYDYYGIDVHEQIRINGTCQLGCPSDRRLKHGIAAIEHPLDKMLKLRGHTYEWNDAGKEGMPDGPQLGMLAQEVEEVFPSWVHQRSDGYKTLSPRGFEALTVESFRTLKAENDALLARLERLEASVEVPRAGVITDMRTILLVAFGALFGSVLARKRSEKRQ